MLLQALQDELRDPTVFCKGFCEYQNVIDVHTHGTFHDEVVEVVIHHGLKGCKAVHESMYYMPSESVQPGDDMSALKL